MVSVTVAGVALLVTGGACLMSGCGNLGYYAQSVNGHLSILRSSKPVAQWLASDQTATRLKARLTLSQKMRDFAVSELKEPDNASYRRFADLKRSSAVWNVVATSELSLDLKTWCFLLVGCVGYKGYYEQTQANAFASALRTQNLEVAVYGVPAYSTLGFLPFDTFADPLLSTFINYSEGELARLIFHELAHQLAFAQGDTVFNESFATMVERMGSAKWLKDHASPEVQQEDERLTARKQDFRRLTAHYRERLKSLYKSSGSDIDKRIAKNKLMDELRAEYEKLKQERWGGYSGYDDWFANANNASFAVLGAYNDLVPHFERLFEREGRDLLQFYAEVKRLAALPYAQRRAGLP
jgi:predicted aminopeptidase